MREKLGKLGKKVTQGSRVESVYIDGVNFDGTANVIYNGLLIPSVPATSGVRIGSAAKMIISSSGSKRVIS